MRKKRFSLVFQVLSKIYEKIPRIGGKWKLQAKLLINVRFVAKSDANPREKKRRLEISANPRLKSDENDGI